MSDTTPGIRDMRRIVPTRIQLASEAAVTREEPGGGATLPLVIRANGSGADLVDWAGGEVATVEADLATYGAILFRGFGITDAETFERFASVFTDQLFRENGEHPRAAISGGVYTPTFFPPEEHLLWHNENSFNDEGPAKIWFCCTRPADAGGETPIVDSRAVYTRLDPDLRAEFVAKGVTYVRNYGSGLGLDWRQVFRTQDRAAVEAHCVAHRLDFEWREDRLRTTAVRPAAIRHFRTGEWSWFNQVQHWHLSCLNEPTRESLLATFPVDELPRTCAFGDGTPIPDEAMAEICRVYRELEVATPWARGDVLMVDNILAAHARNPFRGERKLLVAMGEMVAFQ